MYFKKHIQEVSSLISFGTLLAEITFTWLPPSKWKMNDFFHSGASNAKWIFSSSVGGGIFSEIAPTLIPLTIFFWIPVPFLLLFETVAVWWLRISFYLFFHLKTQCREKFCEGILRWRCVFFGDWNRYC